MLRKSSSVRSGLKVNLQYRGYPEGPYVTTWHFGVKYSLLGRYAEREEFHPGEFAVFETQRALAIGLFGQSPARTVTGNEQSELEKTPERLSSIETTMSRALKSESCGISEDFLKALMRMFKLPEKTSRGAQMWKFFAECTPKDLEAELARITYGTWSRPSGNPLLDPDGPLAWLVPFGLKRTGLTMAVVDPSQLRFDEDYVYEPGENFDPGSNVQIELELDAQRFSVVLLMYPPAPQPTAKCIVPSPRVRDHLLPKGTNILPIESRDGARVFQVPRTAGHYLLVAILAKEDIACDWLREHARSSMYYVPDSSDLRRLEMELTRIGAQNVEVRYLPFSVGIA